MEREVQAVDSGISILAFLFKVFFFLKAPMHICQFADELYFIVVYHNGVQN
jgi:hypothetical protein